MPAPAPRLLPRILALAVAASLASGTAWGNPGGATVTSGSAAISSSGSTLTVTNTPNTIIQWHDFSISAGETTRFIQQSSTSAVLNRVTGGDTSLILGTLQSNGRVYLINPAGIIFGAGSVVDVAGLVASTLNITDDDFLAGEHFYNADTATAGNIVNAGEIRTPNGGFVYLIGTRVENSGIVNTPGGEAILAAGHSVEIVDSTDPALRVTVSAQSQDVNLSQMMLENDGNIFAVLNSGRVSANTVTQDATGTIHFRSAGTVETTAGSITETKGSETLDGGYIRAFAALTGTYAGLMDASGRNGGFIETSGSAVDLTGIDLNLRALSADGDGGHWLLDPTNITIDGTLAATIVTQLDAGTDVTVDTASGGSDAGNIDVTSDIITSFAGDVDLTLRANNDITFDPGVDIKTTSGTLNVTLNADSDGNGSGGVTFSNPTSNSVIETNGGNIVIGGGTNPLTGLAGSIVLENTSLDAGNTGDITINGNGVMIDSFVTSDNLTINAGSGTLQLIGDGSGDNDIGVDGTATLRGASIQLSNEMNFSTADAVIVGALSVTGDSDITASNNISVSNGAVSLTDSRLTASNNLTISNGDALTLDNSTLEAQGGAASLQVSSVTMDDDAQIETSGNLTLTVSGGYTATNNANIDVTGNAQITVGGAMNVSDSEITANGTLGVTAGTATLTDATFDSGGNLTMNVGSLHMTRSTVGDPSGMTPPEIAIVSGGNVILNDGSDIVADLEVRMQVAGKIYLNSGGSGESHISTFSNNTIFLYFPTLFSGGYVLDGIEGILFSPVNQYTGFFTGTGLDTLAILNGNLFITYAPAGPITGIVGQTTPTSQITNPYLDPYGPQQTGPGDSSFPSDVTWPYPLHDPFAEVRECS